VDKFLRSRESTIGINDFFEKKLQWLRAIYRFQSEPYLDRNMLEILVHSIYLYPDNRMEINLNFKDEYGEMMKEEA